MKSWSAWVVPCLIVLVGIWTALTTPFSSALLQDTDTRVALTKIQERSAPLSWFAGDWPLANGFYRPIPALSLEAGLRMHPDDPRGFGLTNILIVFAGILALYAWLAELTESRVLACLAVFVLLGWLFPGLTSPIVVLTYLAWGAAIGLAIWRRRLEPIFALLTTLFLFLEIMGTRSIGTHNGLAGFTLYWVPGRTATLMAFFAMSALACYVRYERSGHREIKVEHSTWYPSATRTFVEAKIVRWPGVWLALSMVLSGMAFACYEQAVMLPAVLTGTALIMHFRGWRVRWKWHFAYWSFIPAYLILRHALLPTRVTGYQSQQFRHGPQVYYDLLNCLLPAGIEVRDAIASIAGNPYFLLVGSFYVSLLMIASNLTAISELRRKHWVLGFGGLVAAFVAFLPMAWLKYFPHYIFWPMMLRTLFVVGLVLATKDAWVSAASLQAQVAPPRPNPAPGSLPHR